MDLPALARLEALAGVLGEKVELRLGAEVVARVLAATPGGGRGLLSLAGRRVPAELPPGLAAGQRLALRVAGEEEGRVLLQLLRGGGAEEASGSREALAGGLAPGAEAELVRVALAVSPAAVPLPGGGAVTVTVDPDATGGDEDGTGGQSVHVTLHSPALGAIEIGLRLSPSAAAAAVTVEPGEPAALARAAAGELTAALAEALDRPASVNVRTRAAGAPRPAPPAGLEWVDVRA